MIQQDEVDVLVAGFASAEREAIRPIVDQFKQLYFYTNQYEGGVADANTFCTGPVCEQQVIPTVQYMVEKFGPRCYTIAADYNFGQLTAAWTGRSRRWSAARSSARSSSLSVSEFSQVIQRIQQANPDWVMTAGGLEPPQLLPQAAAAGLKYPMASTVNMARATSTSGSRRLARQHAQRDPIPARGAHRAQSRVRQALDGDVPRRPVHRRDGAEHLLHDPPLRQGSGSPARPSRRRCARLELGWNIEAPEGGVFLEPGTYHCAHPIRMAVCDEKPTCVVRDWPMIQAWWLQRLGVNLIRNPEYKQYTPDEDPYFKMFGKVGPVALLAGPGLAAAGSDDHGEARMDGLAVAASVLYQLGTNGAFLLSALGLIVILGMMNIINLAHGELMMLGAYSATAGPARRAVPPRGAARLLGGGAVRDRA